MCKRASKTETLSPTTRIQNGNTNNLPGLVGSLMKGQLVEGKKGDATT